MYLELGALSVHLEEGQTRQVWFEDQEVLRGVYGAVRDSKWRTLPSVAKLGTLCQSDREFSAEFNHVHQCSDIHFEWQGTIAANTDGVRQWQVQWTMDGRSLSSFARNRIGLCALHPIEVFAGRPCSVEQTDGTVMDTRFPSNIAPYPIFSNVRSISCELRKGVSMALKFSGERFETEDQRNWTDASFKTYSTPLHLGFPVQMHPGDRVQQSICMTLRASQAELVRSFSRTFLHPAAVEIRASEKKPTALPAVGVALRHSANFCSVEEQVLLKALRLGHLRVEIDFAAEDWKVNLAQAIEVARALATPLEIALLSSPGPQELADLVTQLSEPAVPTARILCRNVSPLLHIERLRDILGSPLFVGTADNYADLNRARPSRDVAYGVCFSLNPQVHSFDSQTVMQNLSAQRQAVEDVRAWRPRTRVAVSPVTFLPRSPSGGPLGPTPADSTQIGFDARQSRCFGAAWTMGSLCSLTKASTESVTYFETTGAIGVIGTNLHAYPHSGKKVRASPLYHVLADFGEFAACQAHFPEISDDEAVASVVLRGASGSALLMANLSATERKVVIEPGVLSRQHGPARLRLLDESTEELACTQPNLFRSECHDTLNSLHGTARISLKPYAYARIQTGRAGNCDSV